MKSLLCLLLLAASVACGVFGQESTGTVLELGSGRILASKFFLSQYAVEDRDYVVEYNLYNVGDRVSNHFLLSQFVQKLGTSITSLSDCKKLTIVFSGSQTVEFFSRP